MRRLLISIATGLLCVGAAHAQKVSQGWGISCETGDQVRRILDLAGQGTGDEVVARVNAEAGVEVCYNTPLKFVLVEDFVPYLSLRGNYRIHQVVVLSAQAKPGHWQDYVQSPIRFVGIKAGEEPLKDA